MASINEHIAALVLLFLAAFSLTSKVWHEFRGFLGLLFTFFIAAFTIVGCISVIDQAHANGWTHVQAAWHRWMSPPAIVVNSPTPNFIPFMQQLTNPEPYAEGALVEGIHWNKDLRRYMFYVQNGMDTGEIDNFKQRLYLPFPVVKAEIESSQGCDGVDMYLGDGSNGSSPAPNMELDGGKVVKVDEGGTNMVTISATRMLPEGKIQLKLIVNVHSLSKNQRGVTIYGSEYTVNGNSAHYGRMYRSIDQTDTGGITFGQELHKKGTRMTIPILSTFYVDKHYRPQDIPMPTVPPEDSGYRTDDE